MRQVDQQLREVLTTLQKGVPDLTRWATFGRLHLRGPFGRGRGESSRTNSDWLGTVEETLP
eukprot:34479-Heterocapsa_arctica.AAC.1